METFRTMFDICPKLTTKTPEQVHSCCSGAFLLLLFSFFIVNFLKISNYSGVSDADFKQANTSLAWTD